MERLSDGLPLKWCRTEAREELRRQVGTLRFDLSSLAAGLDKPKRKEAARLQKDFFQKVSWHSIQSDKSHTSRTCLLCLRTGKQAAWQSWKSCTTGNWLLLLLTRAEETGGKTVPVVACMHPSKALACTGVRALAACTGG